MEWCTIESDPGVFTELIEAFGVQDVQVEELFGMEQAEFDRLKPVHGLIFLFKWQESPAQQAPPAFAEDAGLFFAKQVVPNACATQALLSVLLNGGEDVALGPMLEEFKAFTAPLSPEDKGGCIGSQEAIRVAHNSFARAEPFLAEARPEDSETEDAFHFVAYVPHNGRVYELDGLQRAPILLEGTDADWLNVARPAIQGKIEAYSQSEIRFNLMALVKSPISTAREGLEEAQGMLLSLGDGAEHAAERERLQAEVAGLEATIRDEEEKRQAWHTENERRKHNYLPLIVNLLQGLCSAGQMRPLITKAMQRSEEREAEAREAKKAKSSS